jgi:hypothetical protein
MTPEATFTLNLGQREVLLIGSAIDVAQRALADLALNLQTQANAQLAAQTAAPAAPEPSPADPKAQ